jgi:hypothetical protein
LLLIAGNPRQTPERGSLTARECFRCTPNVRPGSRREELTASICRLHCADNRNSYCVLGQIWVAPTTNLCNSTCEGQFHPKCMLNRFRCCSVLILQPAPSKLFSACPGRRWGSPAANETGMDVYNRVDLFTTQNEFGYGPWRCHSADKTRSSLVLARRRSGANLMASVANRFGEMLADGRIGAIMRWTPSCRMSCWRTSGSRSNVEALCCNRRSGQFFNYEALSAGERRVRSL